MPLPRTVPAVAQAVAQMNAGGIPVGPPASFGYGIEGLIGAQWNVDGTAFTAVIESYNPTQPVSPVAPDVIPSIQPQSVVHLPMVVR